MKKCLAVLSALSLAAALTVGSSAAMIGDANGDGKINSADALSVLRYSVGMVDKDFVKANADTNGDGKINSVDALKILQVSVGLDSFDVLPTTKKDALNYYNSALNKTYSQAKKVNIITDDIGTYTLNGKKTEIKSDPIATEAEFKNGEDKDGFKVADYGPGTGLTESMISSATVKKEGNGTKITVVLKSEKVDVKKDAVYNAAGAFPFDYCSDGTEIKDFTSGNVTYTGTVIEAVADSNGRVTEISVKMPYDSVFYMNKDKITEKGQTSYIANFVF